MVPLFPMEEMVKSLKLPYYAVKFNAEQADAIWYKYAEFYSVNGKTLFEVRDADGKETGEYVMYIIFKEK